MVPAKTLSTAFRGHHGSFARQARQYLNSQMRIRHEQLQDLFRLNARATWPLMSFFPKVGFCLPLLSGIHAVMLLVSGADVLPCQMGSTGRCNGCWTAEWTGTSFKTNDGMKPCGRLELISSAGLYSGALASSRLAQVLHERAANSTGLQTAWYLGYRSGS